MNCVTCGRKIPAIRLAALPDTVTCVNCSEEQIKVGVTIWDKSTPSLEIMDQAEADRFGRLERLDGRLGRL